MTGPLALRTCSLKDILLRLSFYVVRIITKNFKTNDSYMEPRLEKIRSPFLTVVTSSASSSFYFPEKGRRY